MHITRPSIQPSRAWSPSRLALAGLAILVLLLGAGMFSVRAAAVLSDVPETGETGRLSLRSNPNPARFLDLAPGSPARWQIAADLQGAESATLNLEMRKNGALVEHPRGLVVSVERCDAEWTGFPDTPSCAANPAAIMTATPLDSYSESSPVLDLNGITAATGKFLLVTLAVEDSPAAAADETLMNLTGDIALALTATGDDATAAPSPALPDAAGRPPLVATGADIAALVALALGTIGLGVVVSSAHASRRSSFETPSQGEQR